MSDRTYEQQRKSQFLTTSEVATQLRCSVRTIHELTRTNAIPHRKMPGTRRCLFLQTELDRWLGGGKLTVRQLPRGGRVVDVDDELAHTP